MGICHICKETTTLYCIDHQKYICLKCITANHPNCTICQYADYVDREIKKDTTCASCHEEIFEEDPCIRLPCLHRTHTDCFKKMVSDSINEAKCPVCNDVIFKEENATNPLLIHIVSLLQHDMPQVKAYGEEHCMVAEQKTETDPEPEVISLSTADEDLVIESETTSSQQETKDVSINVDQPGDDDTKRRDMEGNSLLQTKVRISTRTRSLIVVLVICFIVLGWRLYQQSTSSGHVKN